MPGPKPIDIPPRGTRGSSMPFGGALMKLAKPFMDMQISRYRRTAGPTQPQMMGFPAILLTTVGAPSGVARTHVLGGFPEREDARLVLASHRAPPPHPSSSTTLPQHP